MWQADIESLEAGRVGRVHIRHGDSVLDYAAMLEGLVQSAAFRTFFNGVLAGAPFGAFFKVAAADGRPAGRSTLSCAPQTKTT